MTMIADVKVTGAKEVQAEIQALLSTFPERVASALTVEADLTMTEAKRLCPVVTGALRASGYARDPVIDAHEVSVTVGFGGAAEKYALKVHENPRAGQTGGWGPQGPTEIAFRVIGGLVRPIGAQRKRYSTVGQWKYLEQPFLARAKGLAERIRARVLKAH